MLKILNLPLFLLQCTNNMFAFNVHCCKLSTCIGIMPILEVSELKKNNAPCDFNEWQHECNFLNNIADFMLSPKYYDFTNRPNRKILHKQENNILSRYFCCSTTLLINAWLMFVFENTLVNRTKYAANKARRST